jgi:hypothetical protein
MNPTRNIIAKALILISAQMFFFMPAGAQANENKKSATESKSTSGTATYRVLDVYDKPVKSAEICLQWEPRGMCGGVCSDIKIITTSKGKFSFQYGDKPQSIGIKQDNFMIGVVLSPGEDPSRIIRLPRIESEYRMMSQVKNELCSTDNPECDAATEEKISKLDHLLTIGDIKGKVLDLDGHGVSGTILRVSNCCYTRAAQTDADGDFILRSQTPGGCDLTMAIAIRLDKKKYSINIKHRPGYDLVLKIQLVPDPTPPESSPQGTTQVVPNK